MKNTSFDCPDPINSYVMLVKILHMRKRCFFSSNKHITVLRLSLEEKNLLSQDDEMDL